ncbi:MAG: Hsp20/alpha crystallin family protein [Gammaproteobacteria bacterium]|nr:Hsp20/alpha crystallin family protein [Gammaproteobacteria bacterium]
MFDSLINPEGSLFNDFRRMQLEMDELIANGRWPSSIRAVAQGTFPPINVGTTPDRVDVFVFVPGIDSSSLDISIQRNLLTIAGVRRLITEEGANYYRNERFDGEFRRVITLPEDVDQEHVEADYTNGVLHVVIQRREVARPKQIPVN